MVRLQLGLAEVPQPNDAADALAVAICHLREIHLSNLLANQSRGEMISSLHGKLESLGSDGAIINVGGIGFQVYMPTSDLSTLGNTGDEVKLYTHLHLREDNVALYGFISADELRLFRNPD